MWLTIRIFLGQKRGGRGRKGKAESCALSQFQWEHAPLYLPQPLSRSAHAALTVSITETSSKSLTHRISYSSSINSGISN